MVILAEANSIPFATHKCSIYLVTPFEIPLKPLRGYCMARSPISKEERNYAFFE